MFRLVVKDLKVIRFFWLPVLFFYIFFISAFVQLNLLYLAINLVICFLLVLAMPIVEDKWGLESFLCSLPVKRSAVVGARYLSAGLTLLVCLAVYLSTAPLLAKLFSIEATQPDIFLTPAGALAFLLPMIFVLSLFLPLYFRLGLSKGFLALTVACLGLFILLTGAVRLASRLLRRPVSELFPVDMEVMFVPYKPLVPLFSELKEALGTFGLSALLLALFGGMVALSLSLSIRGFMKREL
ncbi:MAG: hypothetical protein A2Y56_13340 [Candidatus Aminicenantes bacterium RBG_13_63_10]|nr:MAG: hypothetical protein A2Y56_13340 [Candidatus Aminicenantes bacterium RBG_13_63_10]